MSFASVYSDGLCERRRRPVSWEKKGISALPRSLRLFLPGSLTLLFFFPPSSGSSLSNHSLPFPHNTTGMRSGEYCPRSWWSCALDGLFPPRPAPPETGGRRRRLRPALAAAPRGGRRACGRRACVRACVRARVCLPARERARDRGEGGGSAPPPPPLPSPAPLIPFTPGVGEQTPAPPGRTEEKKKRATVGPAAARSLRALPVLPWLSHHPPPSKSSRRKKNSHVAVRRRRVQPRSAPPRARQGRRRRRRRRGRAAPAVRRAALARRGARRALRRGRGRPGARAA